MTVKKMIYCRKQSNDQKTKFKILYDKKGSELFDKITKLKNIIPQKKN